MTEAEWNTTLHVMRGTANRPSHLWDRKRGRESFPPLAILKDSRALVLSPPVAERARQRWESRANSEKPEAASFACPAVPQTSSGRPGLARHVGGSPPQSSARGRRASAGGARAAPREAPCASCWPSAVRDLKARAAFPFRDWPKRAGCLRAS